MKKEKIIVNKVLGHKKYKPVEVIEGSAEHKELIRWNRAMNFTINQDRKELDKLNIRVEMEISADLLYEESGFEIPDNDTLSPAEYYIQELIKEMIWDGVQQLPENQRDIIILHFYKHKSLREIAKIKGVNHSSINKSFQSALEKLRVILSDLKNF